MGEQGEGRSSEVSTAASCEEERAAAAPGQPELATSGRVVRRPHWRRLLSGSSPREVLARLVNGDPLGVRELVARRLREHGYLLDADRVFLRAIARCARFSARYRGQPALEEWLVERVDEALGDLLNEDLEAVRRRAAMSGTPDSSGPSGPEGGGVAGGAHEDFARPLGLDPARMRLACVAFNHLDLPARRAFFDLVIEGRSLDALARSSGTSATDLARRARRALDACLAAGAETESAVEIGRATAPREGTR